MYFKHLISGVMSGSHGHVPLIGYQTGCVPAGQVLYLKHLISGVISGSHEQILVVALYYRRKVRYETRETRACSIQLTTGWKPTSHTFFKHSTAGSIGTSSFTHEHIFVTGSHYKLSK